MQARAGSCNHSLTEILGPGKGGIIQLVPNTNTTYIQSMLWRFTPVVPTPPTPTCKRSKGIGAW